jgi:sugar phosphate isomerase/epimerase
MTGVTMQRFTSLALAALFPALACARTAPAASDTASASATPAMAPTSTGDSVATIGQNGPPIGLQLWTLREMAKTDPAATFKLARSWGVTQVETAGLYGMTAAQMADALRAAGLRATSMHVGYDEFSKNPQQVIADAKALGATYVGTAWIPHDGAFNEATARKAIADFNAWGKLLHDNGLTFFYHTHGYEPQPYKDGTLLDLLIKETDPNLVKYEMDVLWTYLPGGDPVGLIRKYPGRFKLMHIKDMKPGVPRGSLSGGLADTLESVIGQGQVNWPELIAAARKDGLEYYYIEDESPDPVHNAPKSIAYLEQLKY